MRLILRCLLSVAAGLAAGASFEPYGLGLLVVPAVAGLSVAVHGLKGVRAALVGLLFGGAFMGLLLPWLQVIGTDAWIGLSVLEAAFYGLLGLLLARAQHLPLWPVWAATCWVATDALRAVVPWGGFPWGRLAFATVDTPLAPTMAWASTSGTTFLVAVLGSTLAWLLLVGARTRRGWAAPAVLAALALAAAPSVLPRPGSGTSDATVRVAAVQGDVPGEGMEAFAERRAVLDNHVDATVDLAARITDGEAERPDLVLWPENSTDIDPFEDDSVFDDIQRAADAVDVPVLVGAMVRGPGPVDVRNQGIVWSPATAAEPGPGQRYSKTHPVPFGEYIPLRAQLAQVFERLDQIPRDMVAGTEPGLLEVAGTTLGDVICFEVAYDEVVHDVVDGGAELLVVQTNNATYMGTGQVEQQFAIARLRALETSRYVAVVATNGVSGFVAPDGSVVMRARTRQPVVLEDDLGLRSVITPGVRWSRSIELALVAVALLAALAGGVVRRRQARRADREAPPAAGPGPAEPGSAERPGGHPADSATVEARP